MAKIFAWGVLVVMFDLILEQLAIIWIMELAGRQNICHINYVCWFLVAQIWFFCLGKFAPVRALRYMWSAITNFYGGVFLYARCRAIL